MSLVQLFKKKSKVSLFTTPSHAQKFFIFPKFRQFYKYDISETDTHNPQKALISAQKRATEIYKTKSTHFLINGSTSGIIASVLACTEGKSEKGKVKGGLNTIASLRETSIASDEAIQKDNILIWDNSHISHKNAVALAGANPIFYEVEKDEDWGIFKNVEPEKIEEKLQNEKIKVVIITSPTYEGVVSDITSIRKICKKYGAYLIVDEAHGALYPFCDKLPASAIYQGADFVIQSLHKTAGGLNPTALLHCNIEDVNIEAALNLISTTSPSYPLLATIEKNINFLNSKKGRKKILTLIEHIENMKKNLTNCEFYSGDPTKILTKVPSLSGVELSEILFKKHKIEDEISNKKSVMFLCGVGTSFKKLKKLEQALKKVAF